MSDEQTLTTFAARIAETFGDRPAIRYRDGDQWRDITYRELGDDVAAVAGGLIGLGVGVGDRVAILANTRADWMRAALAVSAAGAVVVTVYPTNAAEEVAWVVGNSGATVVVCEDAAQVAKVDRVRAELPELQHVVVIDKGDLSLPSLDDLRAGGPAPADELARRDAAVGIDDAHTIIYTSGTTGPPKGCVLTHRNLRECALLVREMDIAGPDDVAYLFLPLAHVFALLIHTGLLAAGGTTALWGGDIAQIVAELGQVQPTVLPSVPRIFEKVYAMVAPADGKPLDDDGKAFVRALFGGRVRFAISGAAPIAPDILEFFFDCGVPVYEGWGMTETTGIGTVNLPDGGTRFGTIGKPVPRVQLRIGDDGEILMKGPVVFRGYWQNPQATADAFDADGWLQTGDLGSIDDDGFVRIIGRKKEILITAGGKNLAPANLENDLKQSRYISQAVMYADRKPYPVVLVTLDPDTATPWAAAQGLPTDMAELVKTDAARTLVQTEVDRANAKYASVEQVKKFDILPHDLTVDGGELTPSLKVKRKVVYDKYEQIFEDLYS